MFDLQKFLELLLKYQKVEGDYHIQQAINHYIDLVTILINSNLIPEKEDLETMQEFEAKIFEELN